MSHIFHIFKIQVSSKGANSEGISSGMDLDRMSHLYQKLAPTIL